MEADPGTFTADSLKAYMSLGVNRFSIGIQAFQQVGSEPVIGETPLHCLYELSISPEQC